MSCSPILKIPNEILDSIAGRLPVADFANLRLVSREMSSRVSSKFGAVFFRTRQFMLSHHSLETLLNIARTPYLASGLRKVIIGLNEATNSTGRTKHRPTAEFICQQDALLMNGYHIAYLRQAFDSLKQHVSRIEVEVRDYDSPTRYRENTTWKSYGAPTLISKGINVGYKTVGPDRFYRHDMRTVGRGPNVSIATKAISGLLTALGMSDIQCTSFKVNVRSATIPDSAYYVHPWMNIHVIQKLNTFHANIGRVDSRLHATDMQLAQFLSHAVKLRHLRLNAKIFGILNRCRLALRKVQLVSIEFGTYEKGVEKYIAWLEQFRETLTSVTFHKVTTDFLRLTDYMSSLPWLSTVVFKDCHCLFHQSFSWPLPSGPPPGAGVIQGPTLFPASPMLDAICVPELVITLGTRYPADDGKEHLTRQFHELQKEIVRLCSEPTAYSQTAASELAREEDCDRPLPELTDNQ
ncbi:hypothetical protein EJ06DRAFT_550350 [Trichodelitschia bisporula]|uniref:F-box domain-containing protein n=1 Tax=Trichodelitschia bisporula TaxID=703511 RepID=A0A6G1HRC6_9PEZI|nr:hypothetical protein EJ06DRAFT_550350 [Trichodelitschia bisporula]